MWTFDALVTPLLCHVTFPAHGLLEMIRIPADASIRVQASDHDLWHMI